MYRNGLRGLIAGWVGAAVLVIAAQSNVALAQQQTAVTLRVANYGGSFTAAQRKYTADLFTKRTGTTVQYIDGNPADHLAKMIASRGREPPYDVVYLDEDVQAQAIKAGVLQTLDKSLVPNLKFIYDEALNKDGYGPAIIFVEIGIAYNTVKFAEARIPAPTSWEDIWDPRLTGHLAIPDPSHIAGRSLVIIASRLAGGDEKTLEKGIEKIATLKPHSYYSASAQVEGLLTSGDAWAAPMVSGRAWGMIDRGIPLAFLLPKEKGVSAPTTVDFVTGSKNPKEAHAYIDFTLDPLPQLGQAYEIPYGPTNKLLGPVIAAYPDMAKKFAASPADLQKLYWPDWEEYYKHHQKVVDLWNRLVIRR
jgi:putative spermidine/putrescine transport system substrate-binding protein